MHIIPQTQSLTVKEHSVGAFLIKKHTVKSLVDFQRRSDEIGVRNGSPSNIPYFYIRVFPPSGDI